MENISLSFDTVMPTNNMTLGMMAMERRFEGARIVNRLGINPKSVRPTTNIFTGAYRARAKGYSQPKIDQ